MSVTSVTARRYEERTRIAGRYRLEKELGRGGMGAVFRAVDESTGRVVALKRLHESSTSHVSKLFEREFHTLSHLRHPRIIEVYDYGVDAEGAFYTMELLEGADLRDLAPMPYREACRHLRDIASSLALLHARRLLHRDVSPRNIRLTGDGRAKLIDFGALTSFGTSEKIVGTPPAVPPEALYGLELDQRSDLYGLGALCYWLLTKHHAYPARDLSQLPSLWKAGSPAPPSEFQSDIPPDLDHLVLRLLSRDPLVRPTSAAEVIEHLELIGELPSEERIAVGAGYLANPRLVGRDRELSRLRAVVERLKASESGGAVIVDGPSGSGKSRLLSEGAFEAEVQGAVVLRVDAELHRGPYGAVQALAKVLLAKLPEVAIESVRPHVSRLGHLVPELAQRANVSELQKLSPDRGERRVLLQDAVAQWLVAVALRVPLVAIVDNAHRADESSLTLFAILPRLAPRAPIALFYEVRTDEQPASPRAFRVLYENSTRVTLGGLDPARTTELVQALFGNVNNAGHLGAWLHARAGGNPMHCLALAKQLIELKLITYVNGTWMLPLQLAEDVASPDMRGVLDRRLSKLTQSSRALAESLSVSRGVFSVEQCLAIGSLSDADTFSALAELVAEEILVAVGEDYRFSHTALREYLYASLPRARLRLLHRRAGDFLLKQGKKDSLSRTDAGWHLLRGGDSLRGAEILSDVGQRLVSTIEGLSFAAPALEAALEVFDRERSSKWEILPVLDALTSAGWYVDRKYAEKYGDRTLDLALELSGLKMAEKLSKVMGPKAAVKLGTAMAAVRHARDRRHIRSRPFKKFTGVFGPLIASLGCLIGVAANCYDPVRARRVLRAVRMMSAFDEDHILAVMYDYARYFTLAAEGRYSEAEPIALRVLSWLKSPAAIKILKPDGARALSGGVMTGLAHYAAHKDDDSALRWADELDALGLRFYANLANQSRFMYHAFRGEMARARPYRDKLELNAIQGGTTWQSAITLSVTLAAVCACTCDPVGLRQALAQLDARVEEVPSLASVSKSLQSFYEFQRGRPENALAIIEPDENALLDRITTTWGIAATTYAGSLLRLGRGDKAKAVLDAVRSMMDPADLTFPTLYLGVDLVQASLEAQYGRMDDAKRRLDALIERHRPNQAPLTMFRLHEAYARLAVDCADMDSFETHVKECQMWARYSENPALMARFKRLENQAARSSAPLSSRSVARVDTYASAARSLLQEKDALERAAAALGIAVERSGARGGFLYAGRPPDCHLVARAPAGESPPPVLTARLEDLAKTIRDCQDFLTATQMNTATLAASMGAAEGTDDIGELHLELLLLPNTSEALVVGALALMPSATGFQPLGFELLEAIAESLYGITDYSANTRVDGEEPFNDGVDRPSR